MRFFPPEKGQPEKNAAFAKVNAMIEATLSGNLREVERILRTMDSQTQGTALLDTKARGFSRPNVSSSGLSPIQKAGLYRYIISASNTPKRIAAATYLQSQTAARKQASKKANKEQS